MRTFHTRLARTCTWIGCAVLAAIVAGTPVAATSEPSVLRCDGDPHLNKIVAQGLARSATLRSLVTELERTHVIAYASISRGLPPGVGGRVRFIGTGDGWRFLRIEVDDRCSKVELLALLGHELQHATEIAAAPGVTDSASMAALYDRIGLGRMESRAPGDPAWYETQAAIDVQRRVYGELFGDGW
jgi:hypothetical protein